MSCVHVSFTTVEQAFAVINYSLHSGSSSQATLHALQSEFAGMVGLIRDDCADRYHAALKNARDEKGEVCTAMGTLLLYIYMYICVLCVACIIMHVQCT